MSPVVARHHVLPDVGILLAAHDALVLLWRLVVLANLADGAPLRLEAQPDRVGGLIGHDVRQLLDDVPLGLFAVAGAEDFPVRGRHDAVVVQRFGPRRH